MGKTYRDYPNLCAEDSAANPEVIQAALDAIESGAWTEECPEQGANGLHGCVIDAVNWERTLHPEASVSQLCSYLLFDFNRMARLRVELAPFLSQRKA